MKRCELCNMQDTLTTVRVLGKKRNLCTSCKPLTQEDGELLAIEFMSEQEQEVELENCLLELEHVQTKIELLRKKVYHHKKYKGWTLREEVRKNKQYWTAYKYEEGKQVRFSLKKPEKFFDEIDNRE